MWYTSIGYNRIDRLLDSLWRVHATYRPISLPRVRLWARWREGVLFELIQADAHLSIPLASSHLSISGLFAVQVTNLGETKRGMRSEASPMQILTQTTLKKPCHSVTQLLE